jgi:hypothetical protein
MAGPSQNEDESPLSWRQWKRVSVLRAHFAIDLGTQT